MAADLKYYEQPLYPTWRSRFNAVKSWLRMCNSVQAGMVETNLGYISINLRLRRV